MDLIIFTEIINLTKSKKKKKKKKILKNQKEEKEKRRKKKTLNFLDPLQSRFD